MKVGDFQIQQMTRQVPGFDPLRPVAPADKTGSANGSRQTSEVTPFSQVLDKTIQETGGLKFSAHAVRRLDDRGIVLGPDEVNRLYDGVQKMADKGAQSSLLLMNDNAYIVSVKNKTVVTAMDMQTARENVFTNIDSVAFL